MTGVQTCALPISAFDEGPAANAEVAAQADEALAKRLAELTVPVCEGSVAPPAVAESVGPDGLAFTAVGKGPVSAVHLEQSPDDSGDWTIVLTEGPGVEEAFEAGYGDFPRGSITLRLTPGGGWRASRPDEPPTAVSGGWIDSDTLRFDILFLETPHRVHVTCDLALRTVEARYRTTPLQINSLTWLRAPRIEP